MGYTPPWINLVKASGYYNLSPPGETSDDVYIKPNPVDARAYVLVKGLGGVDIAVSSGQRVVIVDQSTGSLSMGYVTASNHVIIESTIDAKDLYLATTGTGVLKFGTYTAGAATDSTGYITIKDAAGNTRKLMVQA